MGREKSLKNIAGGIQNAFVSRNNDVGGYWAMGQLWLFAIQRRATRVRIDLLARTIDPASSQFEPMVDRYARYLERRLAAIGMAPAQLVGAMVEVDFDPPPPVSEPTHLGPGDLFELGVTLSTGTGRHCRVVGYGRCRPHDSHGETMSARPDREVRA